MHNAPDMKERSNKDFFFIRTKINRVDETLSPFLSVGNKQSLAPRNRKKGRKRDLMSHFWLTGKHVEILFGCV